MMNHVTYISAGAGSGKTFTLTTFLSHLIENGVDPEKFILTTFTEAAASEFREKAKGKIYESGFNNCAQMAERLDQAMIGTIDSVAYHFVQKYWYLLNISPNLKMLDDDSKKFFIGQTIATSANEQQLLFLRKFCEEFGISYSYGSGKFGNNYDFWKDDVSKIFDKAKDFGVIDFTDSLNRSLQIASDICGFWNLNYDADELLALLDEIEPLVQAGGDGPTKEERLASISNFKHLLQKPMTIKSLSDYKSFIAKLPKRDIRGHLSDRLRIVEDSLIHDYDNQTVNDLASEYIRIIFTLADSTKRKYEEYKIKQHLIDFSDIEDNFRKLLDMDEVIEDIRNSYRYVFVDEFQDSSPLQVKIFERLSEIVGKDEDDDYIITLPGTDEHPDKSFHIHNSVWVGDFKQAIYGFRGADTELTKAVADIIAEKHQTDPIRYSIDTLDTSFRSLEPIVNFTNRIFTKTFEGILPPESIVLNAHRGNNQSNSLKAWYFKDARNTLVSDISKHIAKNLIDNPAEKPSDYAVLARSNSVLDSIASSLKELNVPVCRKLKLDEGRDELVLIEALLNLVLYPKDNYSRAVVALMSEDGFTAGSVIDTKLEYNAEIHRLKEEHNPDEKLEYPEYLGENPLIRKLMDNLDFFRLQTIHGLVESLVIELDLLNLGRNWKDSTDSDEAFMSIIESAQTYEELCQDSSIPATVQGFMDYCKENAYSSGSENGVILETFHGSKGLEWKKVILLDLNEDSSDMDKFVKYELYGVHFYHEQQPNAENLYPPMIIRLFPAITNFNSNVPDCVKEKTKSAPIYGMIKASSDSETKRLMYVAITRARDELILTCGGKNPLEIFKLLCVPATNLPESIHGAQTDIFNIGLPFTMENLTLDEGERYNPTVRKIENICKKENKSYKNRDVQPSSSNAKKELAPHTVYKTGQRISISKKAESDIIGSCIHDIFCVLDKAKSAETCEKIINGYGLSGVLENTEEIIGAWNNLDDYLTKTYGAPISKDHEIPFKHFVNGQIVTGSIDFVWKTDKGCVLIDYKTFPGTEQDVLSPGKFYAGKYSGQFECYENALVANGNKVIAKLIYYPVAGLIINLI